MSDTSPFILAAADSTLPNSRTLLASGGLVVQDTGSEGTITVNTSGNLGTLSSYSSPGILVYDTSSGPTFTSRTLVTGTGIAITDPSGQGGNPTISVTAGSTVQKVNVLADGVQISTQPSLNFIGSGAASVTVGDYALGTMANITISTPVSASVDSTYILQTPDDSLPNSQPLSPLSTGILKVTTGTGVVSTAVANTDYQAASTNLTSISGLTPNLGSLIVGSGTAYEGFSSGGSVGDVLTSNGVGALPSWAAPATGNLVVILPPGATLTPLVNKTIYIPTNSGGMFPSQYPFILPTSPTPGEVYIIEGYGSTGWKVSQNSGQQITVGPSQTTVGTAGSVGSRFGSDGIIIYCINSTTFFGRPLSGTLQVG